MRKVSAVGICLLVSICSLTLRADTFKIFEEPSLLRTGPFVDTIIYYDIGGYITYRVDAINRGDVDIDFGKFGPGTVSTVSSEVSLHPCFVGYMYYFDINCERYPLNISGFRRAFAFALNKTKICDEILLDYLHYTIQKHDSVVPSSSTFCIEDDFSTHYYDENLDIANEMLDQLNFTFDSETGNRLTPNGTTFNITVLHRGYLPTDAMAEYAAEVLSSLHIESGARVREDWDDIEEGLYDIHCQSKSFPNDVVWLADEYWSENAEDEDFNVCRFQNTTFDSWRDQLLNGTTYTEVYEASSEMQKILHYNVPRLIVGQRVLYQMYRTDRFEGHIPEFHTITGEWTMRNIHLIGSEIGGTLNVGGDYISYNFNIFYYRYTPSGDPHDLLYSSLYDHGPNNELIPDLATNMVHETHDDNPDVPDGHMRYTVDIIQNATWSDGTPLTGVDVAFTYNYELMSGSYGNPAGRSFDGLVTAYAPTPYRVVIEFDTESYWLLNNFAYNYIIPEHIFNDDYGIGFEAWSEWDPVRNSTHPHVTSGPFRIDEYEPNEFLKLQYNPLFYYVPEHPEPTTSKTTVTVTISPSISNPDDLQSIPWIVFATIAISSGSAIAIVYCVAKIRQYKLAQIQKSAM